MPPLSPIVSLATQMHSQPGVFAVLIGSGVSTGAGLPTGWQVVKELVRRAAVALDPASEGPVGDEDVEAWWTENGVGELGYSGVLEVLAPTSAGRQALLEGFFEAAPDEDTEPTKPSAAHRALARLVAGGTVRVILTTNFDRLMEQALLEEGIHPQVISRPEAVTGMKPLAHAPATLIKLHGDYKDLTTLNTPQELGDYPDQWRDIVAQVIDEYGLLVSGWSADWDTALVHAIESCASRRYPTYWDSRSSRGAAAQRLLSHRSGVAVPSTSADALFTELEASIDALTRLAEPPLTTAIALTRLKRYLHDPTRRTDLHDLVMSRLDPIRTAMEKHGVAPSPGGAEAYGARLQKYLDASTPLLTLLVAGVRYDDEGRHQRLWTEVLERLLALRRPPDGTFNEAMWATQHYPALLAFYAMGAACITAENEALLVAMGRDESWTYPFNGREPEPAAHVLRPDRILDWESLNAFSRWNGTVWQQPPSHLIRTDLHDLLVDLTADGSTKQLFNDLEYRHALLVSKLPGRRARPLTGEYRGDRHWGGETLHQTGQRLRASAARTGTSWPWWSVVGEDLDSTLTELEEAVSWNQS